LERTPAERVAIHTIRLENESRVPVCLPSFTSGPPGEVAERSKAAVLKTVEAQASGGSNPSLSAI
jgi:hypothetical protein